jgi:hypothetical protein
MYHIRWKSQRAILYLDELKNTAFDYSQKLELD